VPPVRLEVNVFANCVRPIVTQLAGNRKVRCTLNRVPVVFEIVNTLLLFVMLRLWMRRMSDTSGIVCPVSLANIKAFVAIKVVSIRYCFTGIFELDPISSPDLDRS
jgi:hypothetical protein